MISKTVARWHGDRLEGLHGVSMVWKCDEAFLQGREIMASHPLDRNRLQLQETEGKGERRKGIRRINWEAKVAGIKVLQSQKVWEDIYRAGHPLGQEYSKPREGVGDMQTSRLHKVGDSSRIFKPESSEIGRGTSADCSHEWLNELAKTAGQFEVFKVHQGLQDLDGLVFSMRWR